MLNYLRRGLKSMTRLFLLFDRVGDRMRVTVTLACTQCKRRNYTTTKNKKNDPGRIEFKKYCRWCGTHTLHKETK